MGDFNMVDALTGDSISRDEQTGDFIVSKGKTPPECKSIFFPGCSMINYAMPLVEDVHGTLTQHGAIDGMSLLCCGKILSYEQNGDEIRAAFEQDLRDHIANTGITRIICACPNCVKALTGAFASDARLADIEIDVLPEVLVNLGYRLDGRKVAQAIKGSAEDDVLLCPHDSCPDRESGRFAESLRAIIGDGVWVDPEHNRSHSICCGSLPRAQGNNMVADRCAGICGSESADTGSDAIVTSCMSCAFQLNMAQSHLPAVHFLELLYGRRIDWASVGAWMKVRFLFNETLGVIESDSVPRSYAGLGSNMPEGQVDEIAYDGDVAISDDDVDTMGL